MTKTPPFKHIVGNDGHYTKEYMKWAIRKENFVGSSLQEEIFPNRGDRRGLDTRTFNGVRYVYVISDARTGFVMKSVILGRRKGGLFRVTAGTRKFHIWFNPNGSMKALRYVEGW